MNAGEILATIAPRCGLNLLNPSVTSALFQDQQLVALLNEAGNEAAKRVDWSELEVTSGFTAQLALPDDFDRMKAVHFGGTPLRNISKPSDWAFLKQHASTTPYYHISDGNIRSTATGYVSFVYQSSHWATGKSAVTSDDDVILIPPRIVEMGTVWRFNRQKGFAYQDLLDEYEAALAEYEKSSRG